MGSVGSSERSYNEATVRYNAYDLDVERGMPSIQVSNVREENWTVKADVNMNRSVIQPGDSFGIRILGMKNVDVYGKVTKVTDSTITVSYKSSTYNIPVKDVEINGRELRFKPNDKNAGWFGFIDLRKYYSKGDFK